MANSKDPVAFSKNELEQVLQRTRDVTAETVDLKQMRNVMKRARLAIIHLEQARDEAKFRKKIDNSIAHAEMRSDLIDREANAARREERQRILFERAHIAAMEQGSKSMQLQNAPCVESYERSLASSRYVEAALASLCPHYPNRPNGGCLVLHK